LLVEASLLGAIGLVAISARVPISEGDDAFYASVARALPSRGSFDYLRFYGPVFFHAVALSFSWLGFSVFALRAVSLLGAALIVTAALMLARTFGADANRQAWIAALLVFSPEVGWAATAGRMDSFAVGLELLGLAIVARVMLRRDRGFTPEILGGGCIAAAALTTPRTFPFVASFFVLGLVVSLLLPHTDGGVRRVVASAFAVIVGLVALWIVFGAGGLGPWWRMMQSIATQQRDDVALLSGPRPLGFAWWRIITPIVAVLGGFLSQIGRPEGARKERIAAGFVLGVAATTFVTTVVLFKLAFFFATFWAVPLFVVVLALSPRLRMPPRAVTMAAACLLLFFGAVRVAKLARAAVTWSARDESRIEAFVSAHVPRGSLVVGPHYLYLFPVERSGSLYETANAPWADWTRWIADEMRAAPPAARSLGASDRFIFWPTNEDLVYGPLPPGACAPGEAIATFEPPPDNLPYLSWLTAPDDLRGYPRATLYRLSNGCAVP
jgi:hypothetical protein